MTPPRPPADRPDLPDEPTAFLPSVGATLPYDARAPRHRPPAYRDPRTSLYRADDLADDDADDRPPPRRRPARHDDEEHYPVSYDGSWALVVVCAVAALCLLAVVWWVGSSP